MKASRIFCIYVMDCWHAASVLPATVPAQRGGRGQPFSRCLLTLLVDAITHSMFCDAADAYESRARETLSRSLRISTQNGQVLSGDQPTLVVPNETGSLGDSGRFLAEAKAPMATANMPVLTDENAAPYFQQAAGRYTFVPDLTPEVTSDLSHGLTFTMTRARFSLRALTRVLVQWVQHFLVLAVTIRPLQKIREGV